MKLAEALLLRADCRKKLESLRDRLSRVARIQEGDQPAEDPTRLLDQVTQVTTSLTDLVVRINQANSNTTLPDGRRITEVLALRDTLEIHHSILKNTLSHATGCTERYSSREIRWVTNVNIVE